MKERIKYTHSAKTRKNISIARLKMKERLGYINSPETRKKQSEIRKNRTLSEETKRKIGDSCRGELSHFWKGGISAVHLLVRKSINYCKWRKEVFQRDNYTCQHCNARGGRLEAHHIKLFSKILKENNIITYEDAMNCEELCNLDNGQTLCIECHNDTKNKN